MFEKPFRIPDQRIRTNPFKQPGIDPYRFSGIVNKPVLVGGGMLVDKPRSTKSGKGYKKKKK